RLFYWAELLCRVLSRWRRGAAQAASMPALPRPPPGGRDRAVLRHSCRKLCHFAAKNLRALSVQLVITTSDFQRLTVHLWLCILLIFRHCLVSTRTRFRQSKSPKPDSSGNSCNGRGH